MTQDEARNIIEGVAPVFAAVGAWWSAHKAAKRSKPTSNGFAQKVTDALERIEARQGKQAKKQKKTDKRLRRLESNESAPEKDAPEVRRRVLGLPDR